jgi:hypothetical protein
MRLHPSRGISRRIWRSLSATSQRGALLGFFLEEIGPNIYNMAVAYAQERLLQRVSELDFEVHEEEFQYWKKYEANAKPRK